MRRTWTTRTVSLGVLSMLAVGLLYPLGAVRAYAQLVQLPRVAVLEF